MMTNRRIQIVALAVLSAISCGVALADTFYVNGDCGNDAWSGKSQVCEEPDGPKATIQAGIDATVDGDEVVVADGTYTGAGNRRMDYGGRLIRVRSKNGPATCIIDCQGVFRAFDFWNDETNEAVLEGLTVKNARSDRRGGAVFCDGTSPMVINCVFSGNSSASGGGGISGNATVINCVFSGNSTEWEGGAISGNATVINCVFTGNTAEWAGGGILGNATVINCTFSGNSTAWEGGAISGNATVINCLFTGNTAKRGGGIFGEATVINCTFSGNRASLYGGGIWARSAHATVINCILWDNNPDQISGYPAAVTYSDVQDGEGKWWFGIGCIERDPLFRGGPSGTWTADAAYDPNEHKTTFTDASAEWEANALVGKFLNPDTTQYLQSVIVANTLTTITVWSDFAELGTADTPYQVNDYHGAAGSPVIDAANNEAVPDGTEFDLDGTPRFADDPDTDDTGKGDPPIVDMGAYEVRGRFCYPCDTNCDGSVDLTDVGPFIKLIVGTLKPCDYCTGDTNDDGSIDLADIEAFIGCLLG